MAAWKIAELIHHPKEEKILFSSLLPNQMVDGGGPLCMIYLDQYIMNSPLDRAKRITGELPAAEEHTRAFFDAGSAMRIPINEHRAGKAILQFLIEHWDDLDSAKKQTALREYVDLENYHMEKEENCFFYHCATLLTPEQADALLAAWQRAPAAD